MEWPFSIATATSYILLLLHPLHLSPLYAASLLLCLHILHKKRCRLQGRATCSTLQGLGVQAGTVSLCKCCSAFPWLIYAICFLQALRKWYWQILVKALVTVTACCSEPRPSRKCPHYMPSLSQCGHMSINQLINKSISSSIDHSWYLCLGSWQCNERWVRP